MARVMINPTVPDRASLDNEIARLRGLDVGDSLDGVSLLKRAGKEQGDHLCLAGWWVVNLVLSECMARPRSASRFLRVGLDQSAAMYPAREH
jgi:hypothetical protein